MSKSILIIYILALITLSSCGGGSNSNSNPPTTPPADFDNDGTPDSTDTDDDNDGVADTIDAFPFDATETTDSDSDGIGDNADPDDDNDGVEDDNDAFPHDANESIDTDSDDIGDNADPDDDNDGVEDNNDAFPLDQSEFLDTDNDGTGNNADSDDDDDGVADADDRFPLDASESADTDMDGIGDNADNKEEHFVYYKGIVGRWTHHAAWDETLGNYYLNNTDNHVTWSERETDEVEHSTVLSVQFNFDSQGNFYIIAPGNIPIDMSAYAGGYITFDIQPESYGETTGDLIFSIDCVWPCTSGDMPIGRPEVGIWTNIRVSIDELVANGLDLTNVNTGFNFKPSSGDQQGVAILLDNIRWEATYPALIDNPGFEISQPSNELNNYNHETLISNIVNPDSRWMSYLGGGAEATFNLKSSSEGYVHSGEHALAVTINAESADTTQLWHIEVVHNDIPVIPGRLYNVTMWVRVEGGAGRFTTGVQLPAELDYAFKILGDYELEEAIYTEITFSNVSIEEGETIIRIPFQFNHAGNAGRTFYIDDLSIDLQE